MCASSNPIEASTACLPGDAVANTSRPRCRAIATAAMPTPPAAACTSSFCPARAPARSTRPYHAVVNAEGTDAARGNDQPPGTGTSSRASVTVTGPNPPSVMPSTRSPGTRPVTPGPVSSTTPATSLPSRPALGSWSSATMPRATSTSRKFSPAARTAMRAWPAASGPASGPACGQGARVRSSSVPRPVTSSRHGPDPGGTRPPGPAGQPAAVHGAVPDRELRLTRAEPGGQRPVRARLVRGGQVGQHQASRVLRLRGADQAPDRRPGQVGHVLPRKRRDRAPGHHHEPGPGRLVRGQPPLHQFAARAPPRPAPIPPRIRGPSRRAPARALGRQGMLCRPARAPGPAPTPP